MAPLIKVKRSSKRLLRRATRNPPTWKANTKAINHESTPPQTASKRYSNNWHKRKQIPD